MSAVQVRGADRAHAVLMLLAALGTLAYWLVYFTSGDTQVRSDEVYLAFENAFPLADAYMALALALGAYFLWRGDTRGVLWGIVGGAAMIFLGCMDLLFNLEQNQFAHMSAEMWAETFIVAFCLCFGPFTVWRLWCHPLRKL